MVMTLVIMAPAAGACAAAQAAQHPTAGRRQLTTNRAQNLQQQPHRSSSRSVCPHTLCFGGHRGAWLACRLLSLSKPQQQRAMRHLGVVLLLLLVQVLCRSNRSSRSSFHRVGLPLLPPRLLHVLQAGAATCAHQA